MANPTVEDAANLLTANLKRIQRELRMAIRDAARLRDMALEQDNDVQSQEDTTT